jgi:iron complex transport system substrate-binding protein
VTVCLRSLLAAALLWAAHAWAEPIRITDQHGMVVTLAAPPQRIVSLLPSLTEAVCVLGACDKLVATDRWSNWPASVQRLPKAGGLDDANVEMVVAQRPDLVLLSASSRLAQRLRGLGLTVAELDAQNLAQLHQLLNTVAALLGQPALGERHWQALQAEVREAHVLVPAAARGSRVYFEISNTLYAAGESSYIGELLARLGARNVVPAALGPFPRLGPEFIVRVDPDVIILAAEDAPGLPRRPGWNRLQAIQAGRVCAVPAEAYDVLSRPGPRLGQAARFLAQCLKDTAPRGPR